jgi:glutathione S-transferase
MIILHHLNFSRSTRVLWLLEELGLDYQLVHYQRGAGFRAPESLKAVHPLGKAPVIQDGDLVLAESAIILSYINDRRGEGRFAPPVGGDARLIHDEWLQYVESSAAFPIMITLIGHMIGGLSDRMGQFAGPELNKAFDYIAAGIGDGPYLTGEAFTIADIQMAYLLDVAHGAGMLAGKSGLVAYLDRVKARPAFVRAIEIGGPMTPPRP